MDATKLTVPIVSVVVIIVAVLGGYKYIEDMKLSFVSKAEASEQHTSAAIAREIGDRETELELVQLKIDGWDPLNYTTSAKADQAMLYLQKKEMILEERLIDLQAEM
jgi:hypothetical protein